MDLGLVHSLAVPDVMDDLDQHLRDRFGLDAFRPWQREAVRELLDGRRRVLVVAPTGGGKSLCYQFPATELEGTTIVVSPLIALMEDQVHALLERGIAATYVASNLSVEERRSREAGLRSGRYRLVYVAPERLAHSAIVESLARLAPPLVAIDEAHCISQWGHDFRPDYLRLGEVLRALAPPRVLACTATATPAVREEILTRLGMPAEQTAVVLRGFARPNLHFAVREEDGRRQRRKVALNEVKRALGAPSRAAGAAIVYTGTRREAEKLSEEAAREGWRTAAYHAGLGPAERARVSHAFAGRELDVVAATNAFGMGIDRPDIRAVIHVQAPGSIEAYYQEVGRAGRDGQPALGLLLTGGSDLGMRRRLIESGGFDGREPDPVQVERQWRMFLDLMKYAEAGSCRHDFILRYFGDEGELLGGCGHCDVCERLERDGVSASDGAPALSAEDTLIVRKALAGVARAQNRVGIRLVAEMLHGGEPSMRAQRSGLERLSTWGLLGTRPSEWIVHLLRRLITAGLVGVSGGDMPLVHLTAAGREVMHDRAPARVLLPPSDAGQKRGVKRAAAAAARSEVDHRPPTPADGRLFDRLKEARLALARARGVAAYLICHDRTLREIAQLRPSTRGELATVYGMGPSRIETCGDDFLAVVARDR